jgi:predicted O-methyltransferase YrrM
MNKQLSLSQVTLVAIDCINAEMAVEALNVSSENIEFGKTLLLSNEKPYNCTDNILFQKIEKISNIHDYNVFILKELHKYINTEHCLIVQADGYVSDLKNWQHSFLDYDYVGSPWTDTEWFTSKKNKELRVGNGGFSLRSKRLLTLTSSLELELEANEDVVICVFSKEILQSKGIKFAPLDIAKFFSQEKVCDDLNVDAEKECFGFHGKNYTQFHLQKQRDLHFQFYKNSLIKMPSDRLMKFLRSEIGVSDTNYFCASFKGNLEVQQIPEEYCKLLNFFKNSKIESYLELGVANGGSFFTNSIFLQNTARTIHCVDCLAYKDAPHVQQTADKILSKVNKLKTLFPKKEFNFFNQSTDEFFLNNKRKYDCIFIDADHSYEGVTKDYLNSLEFVKKDGYLIFHDINNVHTGVARCWNEVSTKHTIVDVYSHPYVNNCGIGIIQV